MLRVVDFAVKAYKGSDSIAVAFAETMAEDLYRRLAKETSVPYEEIILHPHELMYDSKWLESGDSWLSSCWCALHHSCQRNPDLLDKFQLVSWIASVSYAPDSDPQVTQMLLTLFLHPSASSVLLPRRTIYRLSEGYEVNSMDLGRWIRRSAKKMADCKDCMLLSKEDEAERERNRRKNELHDHSIEKATGALSMHLAAQWPCAKPTFPVQGTLLPGTTQVNANHIKMVTAEITIVPGWASWYDNFMFKQYLDRLVSQMRAIPVFGPTGAPEDRPGHTYVSIDCRPGFISIDEIFSRTAPEVETHLDSPIAGEAIAMKTMPCKAVQLTGVLNSLQSAATTVHERRYVESLRESSNNLRSHVSKAIDRDHMRELEDILTHNAEACVANMEEIFNKMAFVASPTGSWEVTEMADSGRFIDHILATARFQPRVCRAFFLTQLQRKPFTSLSNPWKRAVVSFGLAVSNLQQAQRLRRVKDRETDFLREFDNAARGDWNMHNLPEWLLLECESNINIRRVQHQIAEQMIEPPAGENTIMQLNMGEGKSSVIVPMVTASLGDGSRIVRVIVAKPQAKQMCQMLVLKLSGLLNRPVFQMPFCRSIEMDAHKVSVIRQLLARCQAEGGVMMVQPEHLLSFQLMGLECGINQEHSISAEMLSIQKLFDSSARDVVDESDENFNVKFELVYTIGNQQHVEHSPDRWTIAHEVLKTFAECCMAMHHEMPTGLEIEYQGPSRVPRIRILSADAQDIIIARVASHVCYNGLASLPIARQPDGTKSAIFEYISTKSLTPAQISAVEKGSFWGNATKDHILLLRGLCAGGILAFAFAQKRWRVDYGLDENRERKTRVAVPYRAKDNPSPRSEFSHPDVVIILTTLNYYYSGLEDGDLFYLYDRLLRDDNPDVEYEAWVKTAPKLSKAYRQLQGINLRDRALCKADIFPHIRYSRGAIDYFLSKVVFPKECKEYPHKLSASGWDLGKVKGMPLTGFSGTNDSRYLLPLAVKQLDVPEQMHTNALVLEYLLQPENGIVLVPAHIKQVILDSASLLDIIDGTKEDIRVILDVGAQVIDLSNEEFAKAWLEQHADNEQVQAVIFHNDADELVVLDRYGLIEELPRSPFLSQMDRCLVFLDEAHTRGTDLKLPATYRAAVTLGANLTKDRLVQGKSSLIKDHR